MTDHQNESKRAARDIVKRLPGSRVFPLGVGIKYPPPKGWQSIATNDLATIDFLFNNPRQNVGLILGDDIAVIDVEGPEKGLSKGQSGEASLTELIALIGPLPVTLTAKTPSSGFHFYFRIPHRMKFRGSALNKPNIEFRTNGNGAEREGHYQALAPSCTQQGNYQWLDPEAPIADLPSNWVTALDNQVDEPKSKRKLVTTTPSLDSLMREQRQAKFSKQKLPTLEPILQGCAWLRYLAENPSKQDEPSWYAALSIIGRCEGGERLSHEFSRGHVEYDPVQTGQKLAQALEASGPRTCVDIGSEHCKGCVFAHHGEGWSPLALGQHHPGMIEVLSEIVYAIREGVFMQIGVRERVSPTVFARGVQNIIKKAPLDNLLGSASLVRLKRLDYLAGDDRLVVDGVANTWVRDGIQPKEGDCKIILDHFDYLLPEHAERNHILDYFAHLIQKPSIKIAHGLMLTGPQGNGKSTLASIMGSMFGRNARTVDGTELFGRFKSRFIDCQFLNIEEAHHGGRLEAYLETKQLMTSEHFPVEEKGIPRWEGRTPRGIMMCTNDEAGLVMQNGERRWFVATTANHKADAGYFTRLHKALEDKVAIAAFGHYLAHERNISEFNPKTPPPMTAAKQAAVEATATPLVQWLRKAVVDEEFPWTRRTFTTIDEVHASAACARFEIGRHSVEHVKRALREIGATPLPGQVRLPRGKLRLWALRGGQRWLNATAAEIRTQDALDHIPQSGGNVHSLLEKALQRWEAGACLSEESVLEIVESK